MNVERASEDPVVEATIHDPGHDEAHHAHEQGHAFDSPEEVAHAKLHAKQNIFWFIGFFSLVLVAVANYEFSSANSPWMIGLLAASRCLLIAFFMNWLFHGFSLVFRTFLFSAIFLAGMIFLSWWDSTLPHMGNPIYNYTDPASMKP
jgi:hypothetical protein